MESVSATAYSYKRYVCSDCGHRNLLNPAYPLLCPDCQSSNVTEYVRRPEPVYAIEGGYTMKPYYCHSCHRKNLLNTAGPFVCPDCRSDAVEVISEQLKRDDPHFQAILGHPNPKEEPPTVHPQREVVMEPAVPFFDMVSPFSGFDSLFSTFFRPREIFQEGFRRRGTPFTRRQTHLLGHFFDQMPGFDTIPSMQVFFGPQMHFPGQMSFEDLLHFISQQHPDSHNPANPEVVRNLRVVKVNEDMVQRGDACAVCQETLSLGEDVKELPCKHLFHPGCIDPWLTNKNTCPVCRQPIDG